MNYHNISKCDMLNGYGLRVVLWCAHCEHKCEGCQNPETWDINGGIPFDKEAKEELFEELKKQEMKGITCSGGDPLSLSNRKEITMLLKEIKTKFPNKDVWIYTGYEWESIKDLEVMNYTDVLVDGKFKENLSVPHPQWKGSTNQRIIDVQQSIKGNNIVLYI